MARYTVVIRSDLVCRRCIFQRKPRILQACARRIGACGSRGWVGHCVDRTPRSSSIWVNRNIGLEVARSFVAMFDGVMTAMLCKDVGQLNWLSESNLCGFRAICVFWTASNRRPDAATELICYCCCIAVFESWVCSSRGDAIVLRLITTNQLGDGNNYRSGFVF